MIFNEHWETVHCLCRHWWFHPSFNFFLCRWGKFIAAASDVGFKSWLRRLCFFRAGESMFLLTSNMFYEWSFASFVAYCPISWYDEKEQYHCRLWFIIVLNYSFFFSQAHLHCRIHLSFGPRLCNRPMRCVTNRPRPTALTWISDQWSDQSSIKWVKQCHKPPIWEWFIIVLTTLANIFHWNVFCFFYTPYWSIK